MPDEEAMGNAAQAEDIKAVSVLLSARLHSRVKAMSAVRGLALADAYAEALTEWVDRDIPRD
jgi:hypothetical protein